VELSGRIFDEAWQAVVGAGVLLRATEEPARLVSALTDVNGAFQIPDMPPGKYDLQLKMADGSVSRNWPLDLAAGHRRVFVKANEGAQLIFEKAPLDPKILFASSQGNEVIRFDTVEGFEPIIKATVTRDSISKEIELHGNAELRQAHARLAPERLERFLHSQITCQIYNSGEHVLPATAPARCVANALDEVALASWMDLEGVDTDTRLRLADVFFSRPRDANDEDRLNAALRKREALRNELRNGGMLDAEHLAQARQYFQLVTSTVPIMIARLPDNIPEDLREMFGAFSGKTIYMMGQNNFGMFFVEEGGELRLAGILIGGG
jgi:hypothetical protein